jgi:hypothetical protein
MTAVFLQQIGEITPLFEGLKVEVLASCYAITREALYSVLLSLKKKKTFIQDRIRRLTILERLMIVRSIDTTDRYKEVT